MTPTPPEQTTHSSPLHDVPRGQSAQGIEVTSRSPAHCPGMPPRQCSELWHLKTSMGFSSVLKYPFRSFGTNSSPTIDSPVFNDVRFDPRGNVNLHCMARSEPDLGLNCHQKCWPTSPCLWCLLCIRNHEAMPHRHCRLKCPGGTLCIR